MQKSHNSRVADKGQEWREWMIELGKMNGV